MKQDSTLSKIVSMLNHPHPEVQCAAAKVLGELNTRSGEVIAALGQALKSENVLLRSYATEALGRKGNRAALPHLIGQLAGKSEERSKAMDALLMAGTAAIGAVQKQYPKVPMPLKREMIDFLCRSKPDEAVPVLLEILSDCCIETAKHICYCFGQQVSRLDDKAKDVWSSLVEEFLATQGSARGEIPVVASLRLLRYLDRPKSCKLIAGFLHEKQQLIVRRHALFVLRSIGVPKTVGRSLVKPVLKVLSCSRDADSVQAAVDILRRLPLSAKQVPSLQKLLSHQNSAVKRISVIKLAEVPSEDAVLSLLNTMESFDPNTRRKAIEALSRNPAAGPAVLKQFLSAEGFSRLDLLLTVLRRFDQPLDTSSARKLEAKLKAAIQKQDDTAPILFAALNHWKPDVAAKCAVARAQALKRSRKYEQAEGVLAMAERAGSTAPEVRLKLALLRLKISKNDLSRLQRERSPVLRTIAELIREGYPVLKGVKAEKMLGNEDLYYLGFHFSERLGDEREFGCKLLKAVAEKSQRSVVGRNARNKMKLEGIE